MPASSGTLSSSARLTHAAADAFEQGRVKASSLGAMAAEGAGVDQSTWWKGLAAESEDNSLVRSRIHRGNHLLLPDPEAVNKGASEADIEKQFTDKTIMNLRYNVEVLEPALRKWAENDPTAVPLVDDLSSEVEKVLHLCNRDHPGATWVHQDAWALRRLMTLLKSLTTKPKIPKEPCLYWCAMLVVVTSVRA